MNTPARGGFDFLEVVPFDGRNWEESVASIAGHEQPPPPASRNAWRLRTMELKLE